MSRTAVVSATVTIPAESDARALSIDAGTSVPSTAPAASSPQPPAEPNLNLPVLRYAAAVLNGQPDMLESVAACFDGTNAKIRKDEEGWMLESSEFASCTAGEQVFPIADDLVSRVSPRSGGLLRRDRNANSRTYLLDQRGRQEAAYDSGVPAGECDFVQRTRRTQGHERFAATGISGFTGWRGRPQLVASLRHHRIPRRRNRHRPSWTREQKANPYRPANRESPPGDNPVQPLSLMLS